MYEIKQSFKDRLNKALSLRDMRAKDLCARTGLSESTVSQYRTGYAEPKTDKLALIATALNVNPTWLMGLDVPIELHIATRELSNEELDLINAYNASSSEIQEAVRSILKLKKPSTHSELFRAANDK